ncbi:MAG: hypothetical protein QOC95_313 [Thermoleophilaceae bacterium]|nr:hypothetical protein [Thermoleophilaceae bacterium]
MGRLTHVTASLFGLVSLFGGGGASHHESLSPSGRAYGGAYGCCVLALSGHQRHLPGGWTGGDRLAIHATAPGRDPRSGSAGCVVGTDSEIAWLTRRVPLGTLVTVRR